MSTDEQDRARPEKLTLYPSMTALRMLDAVARLGNMHKAADYLCVTPSAVSHQLRKLEQVTGAKLVRRLRRSVELTSAGNRYVLEIRKALSLIEQATLPVADEEPFGKLTINCMPGFGAYWLAQHIGEFQSLYPNISIRVMSTSDKMDLKGDEIDFSILYGDGFWDGLSVQLLYTPAFFPVCSPKLFERHGRLSNPADITQYPLIHHNNYSDWTAWLAAACPKRVQIEGGIVFDDVNHSINAALAGQGVALGDQILAGRALHEGTLLQLFDTEIMGPHSYYIVARDDKIRRRVTRAGIEWLITRLGDNAGQQVLSRSTKT